ncbi:MAG: Ig-like domain-containing protein, partial [Acidobacteriota bacterium]|nr:Ig-like domain-containing protein [Acidobacteriota bacterium]
MSTTHLVSTSLTRLVLVLSFVLALPLAAGTLQSALAATTGGLAEGSKPSAEASLPEALPSTEEDTSATVAEPLTTTAPASSTETATAPAAPPAAEDEPSAAPASEPGADAAETSEAEAAFSSVGPTLAAAAAASETQQAETPPEGQPHLLIPSGAIWKYLDNGTDQGTAWREHSFNDGAWLSGSAQLGYGDGDEKTVIGYGPDPANKHITTYFRRSFSVADASVYKSLKLRLLRDDGAVVYLNGREVFRSNMPAGAVNYKTTAAAGVADANEKTFYEKKIDPSLLLSGANVVAVEVHQDGGASSDLSFDLEFVGSTVVPLVPTGAVWKYLDNGSNQGTAWREPSFADSTWASGPAQLGYGDGDERTVVSYGPDPNKKHITTYFRHAFNVIDPAIYKGLLLRLLKDDGAVVYLNGKEIFRSGIAGGGVVTNTTLASTARYETTFGEKPVDPNLLVKGTNVLAVEVHQDGGTSSDMSFDLELLPTNPAAFVPMGSVWKYLDNGTDQGTAWRETSFSDGAWASGLGQLGYGDGDEKTVISYGTDPNNKHITTYFRRSFSVADPAAYKSLTLRLLRDDGAVVYLNGREVFRSNMPAGAVGYKTTASSNTGHESLFHRAAVDPGLLLRGTNVVAVEVHQDYASSSDLSFDLELIGSKETLADSDGMWKYLDNGTDQGTAWREHSFNDGAWASGSAQLGYGDGDERTVVSYGPDPNNKYVTTYFRRSFGVADASVYKSLKLRLLRDDGAVVYLNGREVFRSNMPVGAVGYQTVSLESADFGEESAFYETTIDASLLANGTNVLAVEVHQSSPTSSSDASFDLELLAGNKPPTVSLTSPADGESFGAPVNVTVSANAADADGTVSKVEFYANSKLIGTATASPYTITWGNVVAGSYTLTAVATDDAGATAVTDSVSMRVEPAAANPNAPAPPPLESCKVADVVALDQAFYYNRLGAFNPAGMIYALRRDVVSVDSSKGLVEGNVQLRPDKRPRPLTLRMNVGDCLTIKFQNLLSPSPADDNQPATRTAGVHVMGLQLVNNILDDGSHVGANNSSLVAPGGTATYTYYAEREGNHLFYSTAATTGGEGDGGQVTMGLFGSVNVEPRGSEWYRSQVTAKELAYATTGRTPANQPIINYDATYPAGHPRAGQPVLKILGPGNEIVHGDLNAIITGPNKGRFPAGTYRANDRVPDRDQPFREFTVVYHDEIKAVQAFPQFFEDPVLSHTLHSVRDGFAINYGAGGIGAEILANRLGVGPMANCTECKYEEFFLSAWVVGDPAQIVDVPASTQIDANGQKIPNAPRATKVLYPDDPSNVHHSYLNDHVKMRVVHAGPKEHHVHHLHAHQWLRTPDSNDSSYLDSQALGPGYSFTTEIAHGGSGNLNKTVGDSIFHCHFYPHFAQGMWELWRTHDVFEAGTELDGAGLPTDGARKLPDAEIAAGTPIPAIVPVPTLAMPPMPTAAFQGYPFYIPGVAGHRPPKPPLDTVDDGGLPRHVVTGGTFEEHHTRLDFNKELLTAVATPLDEGGTAPELAAMQFHGARTHASFTPSGAAANFITNGLPRKDAAATGARKFGAQPGAPFADPCV